MKYLSAQIFSVVFALGLMKWYSYSLDAHEFGEVMLTVSAASLIDAIIYSAVTQASFYICSREVDGVRRVLGLIYYVRVRCWKILLGSIISIYLIYYIKVDLIKYIIMAPLFILCICCDAVRAMVFSVTSVEENKGKLSVMQTMDLLITGVFLAWGVKYYDGVLMFAGIFMMGRVVSAVCLCWVFVKNNKNQANYSNDMLKTIVQLINRTKLFSLMGIMGWGGASIDRFVVGATIGVAEAGVYSAILALFSRPIGVMGAVFSLNYKPKIFKNIENTKIVKKYVLEWVGLISLIYLVGIVVMVTMGAWMFSIMLGDKVREITDLYLVGALTLVVLSIATHVPDNLLLAKSREKQLMYGQMILFPFSIALMWYAGKLGGIYWMLIAKILIELIKISIAMFLVKLNYKRMELL